MEFGRFAPEIKTQTKKRHFILHLLGEVYKKN